MRQIGVAGGNFQSISVFVEKVEGLVSLSPMSLRCMDRECVSQPVVASINSFIAEMCRSAN